MPGSVGGIKAGKAFILIEAIDRTGKILDGIKHKLGRYAADISSMGTTMALRAAAGLTPIALATKTYADFDDSMRRVEARSRGTVAEMEALREQAKLLGRTTAFTASQIGELQAKLAQKGFNRSAILAMTEPIMNLARSGGTGDLLADATMAADLVSGTLRAFQMESKESNRLSDLFTAAINNSNYSLEELTTSLSYAAPAAKNFNMSVEDTLAMLAAMRDLNIDASIAGTAFRNMLNYTSKEAERSKFNDRLKEMTGNTIDFIDAAGNLRNMRDILLGINKAVAGLGTAQRTELYDMLFETRAAVPASAVGRSSDTIARLLTIFGDVNDLSKKTATTMESGLGGSFRELESATEGVAIAIGEALDNALMSLGQRGEDMLGIITQWIKDNEGLTTSIILLTAGFGLLGIAMLLTGQAMLMLTPLFTLATILTGTTAALLTFVAPWALLAAGIYLGSRAVADFIGKQQEFDNVVRDTTASATDFAATRWGAFAEYFGEIGTSLVNTWNDAVTEIAKALQRGDIETASKILWKSLEIIWAEGANALLGVFDQLQIKVQSALQGGNANPFLLGTESNQTYRSMYRDMIAVIETARKIDPLTSSPQHSENYDKSIAHWTKMAEEDEAQYAKRSKFLQEDMDRKDKALSSAADQRLAERTAAIEKLKKEMEDLKQLNYEEGLLAMAWSPDSPTLKTADWASKLEAAATDIVTPLDAMSGRGGLTAPDAIMGLERGSAEAAKAFQEAKFNQFGEKLDAVIEASKKTAGHVESIDAKTGAEEGGSV